MVEAAALDEAIDHFGSQMIYVLMSPWVCGLIMLFRDVFILVFRQTTNENSWTEFELTQSVTFK